MWDEPELLTDAQVEDLHHEEDRRDRARERYFDDICGCNGPTSGHEAEHDPAPREARPGATSGWEAEEPTGEEREPAEKGDAR